MTWSRVTLGCLLAAWSVGSTGCQEDPGPSPAAPSQERAQVSLFWGGGAERAWDGIFELEPATAGTARIEWVWLQDFEEDDAYLAGELVPAPRQSAPATWRATPRGAFEDSPPPGGARLRTATQGEADGLCFEVRGDQGAELVLDFGGDAVLRAKVSELLQHPVVVAADDAGNVLLAQAIDLAEDAAPAALHGDRTARRVCLHAHFTTTESALEPLVESLRPFVPTVWWTDHNIGEDQLVLAGDFETEELVDKYWFARSQDARVTSAGLVDQAHRGRWAYRLEAGAGPEQAGRAWIDVQHGRGAGEFCLTLGMQPGLRWAWKPEPDSEGAPSVAYALVQLHSGRSIRYLSSAPPDPQPTDIVLESSAAAGAWQTFERDVAADARRVHDDLQTDGFRRVYFGVVCPAGKVASALFDDIELEAPPAADVIRTLEETYRDREGLQSFVGLEQSGWLAPDGYGSLYPHLTVLVPSQGPGLATLFAGFDAEPSPDERRAFVHRIQAAGGCVGAHHMQMDDHYEALLDARGLDVDLFEVGGGWFTLPPYTTPAERSDRDAHGYPALSEDEVFPLLVRWDRLTARGLLLTGYGAPDLHQRFDRPNSGWMNRWLSWILAESAAPETQLRALRSGAVSASEWRSQAIVSLSVEGRPWTGKLVATDRERHTVEVHVTNAIPGSRVRWIRGPLVRATADAPIAEPGPVEVPIDGPDHVVDSADFTSRIDVDTRAGVFVRAELSNPAGHLVALSNPVVFVPYWPERWPAGRVAFDWRGVSLQADLENCLERARVGADGSLELAGTVVGSTGALVLSGASSARLAGAASQETADGDLRVDLATGPFTLRLELETPWDPVPTADVRALPARKELLRRIRVGEPASERGVIVSGFGGPYLGPLEIVHFRQIAREPARFRLPVPVGERTWLRLGSHGFSRASGRVLMDGRELGSFGRMEAKTFVIEPTDPGSEDRAPRLFSIVLDPQPSDALLLERIELWRGEGVVDY